MERAAETNEPKTEPKPLIVFLLLIPALTNLCPVLIVPLTLLAPFGDVIPLMILFFPFEIILSEPIRGRFYD